MTDRAGPPRGSVLGDPGGKTDLAGPAGALADAVVVGNAGRAHLAAAVGISIGLLLLAPTVPAAAWRPWRVAQSLLYRNAPCAGCRARACTVEGQPCLGGAAVGEDVVDRLAPATARVAR